MDSPDPFLSALAAAPVAWGGNREVSPESDPGALVLIRIHSFRNFAGLPFVASAPPNVCAIVAEKALSLIARSGGLEVKRLADCPPRVIRMLREREILPRRAVAFPGKKEFKYLAAGPGGRDWILVNEVEHMTFGRNLPGGPGAWMLAQLRPEEPAGDPREAAHLPWAWSRRFGYLASDPSRIGPGIMVEAIAHLPGLALSRQLPHARNYLAAAGVAFLPLALPHGPTAFGPADAGLFRLLSRGGLGKDRDGVYESFTRRVQPVLRLERQARERCRDKHHKRLGERMQQSFQRLTGTPLLDYGEMLAASSLVRMGAGLGMLKPELEGVLEELRVFAASGHLAVTSGRELVKEEEDFTRANVVKSFLMDHSGEVT